MIKYPDDYNPIKEYWEKIENEEILVCTKIKKTYEHIVEQMNDKTSPYHYDPHRANHIIEFIENYCRNSKGKEGGKLVVLELWEKALLATVFGFVDNDDNRQYREALLIVGKKNGKSLLSSCIGTYMLMADSEPGADVYAVATTRDQAKIVWLEAKRMIKKSPVLNGRVRTLVSELANDANDGTFKPLASDSDTLDGLNVHCGLMDEVHQWKNGKALYDIIADGITARDQPLIFITSTAGTVREDIYDIKYEEAEKIINGYSDPEGYKDDRFIPFIYELDSRSEWTEEKYWIKANPSLGRIKNEQALADKVERARSNPGLVKNLVCKEFNIRETSSEAWLTFEQLNNTDTFDLDIKNKQMIWNHNGTQRVLSYPRYGIGGCDLSSTTDLTAAKVIFKVPEAPDIIFSIAMYWLPEDLIEQRAREDKIPYDIWRDRGFLQGSPGTRIKYQDVSEWFVRVQNELDIYLPWIGYDSWSAAYWVEEMQGLFGQVSMVPVIQGKKTLSAPMKALGREFESKNIIYNDNPIDKWCFANTAYEEDRNGNIQPHKTSKETRRIDGMAALLDAYVVYQDNQAEYIDKITPDE